MPHYLSDEELRALAPAETAAFRAPVPTQVVSNGEFNPLPQTREQRRVEARVKSAIFAGNAVRLYGLEVKTALGGAIGADQVAAVKAEYAAAGGLRSNARYGYVHRSTA
jgi:hypothetical protein